MAGRIIHEIGQEAEKNLKDPIRLGCFSDKSGYFCKDVDKKNIFFALFQSLERKGQVSEMISDYGHIVVNECHHVGAATFDRVLSKAIARYVLGLTATPYRRDGHHPVIYMQCGPLRA